ncbi:hypothetical protein [Pseudomonas syringae]|uniref:hypothetical protein n=1 Tax=Pseudomonas syringae TaxID=317 RepID=UPI00035228CF|nr:hypothetical protein [Pseudomonas syringae]EPF66313.1 Prophage PssSM-02, Orf66 [Pseudomonas syringae pv. syringae SM]
MRMLIGTLSLALLAGCSSAPISVGQAEPVPADELYAYQTKPAGDSGKVTVIRDKDLVGSGCDIVVYVDGRKAAKVGTGQRVSFYLKTGSPSIGVGLAESGLCAGAAVRTISANVQNGHESIYRITGDMGGFYVGPYVEYQ